MTCSEIEELLSAYYDGELSANMTAKVGEHVATCNRCAEELAGCKTLSNIARGLHSPAVPGGMWEELESKLNAPATGRSRQTF